MIWEIVFGILVILDVACILLCAGFFFVWPGGPYAQRFYLVSLPLLSATAFVARFA